jgi:hypothetical protein
MPVTSKAQLRFMKAIASGKLKEPKGLSKQQAQEFLSEVSPNLPDRKKPMNSLPVPGRKTYGQK